ncbi:uncharacterized protein LOC111024807 [Momordica charantia]|uniref:Uncharacterized protein LOC111024807 n=1 Tax=Momordica charantia TaxID=3673 RepID=A0A6J1E0I4_MOMCH|nr:uncharacterized protein LOC111024807 [Momordica charantia]
MWLWLGLAARARREEICIHRSRERVYHTTSETRRTPFYFNKVRVGSRESEQLPIQPHYSRFPIAVLQQSGPRRRRFQMEPISYERIIGKGSRRRSQSARGFRLNSRRFSVSRLRAKFMCLLRILNKWRRSIKKMRRSKAEVAEFPWCTDRLRSFRRSNSFYAEAMADCLDFIKTNTSSSLSVAVDQPMVEFRHPSP